MKIFIMSMLIIFNYSFSNNDYWEYDLFGYNLKFDNNWQKTSNENKSVNAIAIQKDQNKIIGELLGAHLDGTIEKESSGMLKSPEMNPGVMVLLDSATLETKSSIKIFTVAIGLNVQMEPFEGPSVFYSIYLPGKSNDTITLKLRCSKKNFKQLKNDILEIVLRM